MKKAVKPTKGVKVRKINVIEPIKQEVIERVPEKRVFEPLNKIIILTKIPVPVGYIRCEVMKDHNGMLDELRAGDIIDLPERRYKSLSFRGMVKRAELGSQPNKRR